MIYKNINKPLQADFFCSLCTSRISNDLYWYDAGDRRIAAHYHCACQAIDRGFVQMQFFDLQEYLDV